MSMLENILSFAASGVLHVLREQNNTMVVTKSDYSPETHTLSYMGTKVAGCEEAGNDATIAGLTGLVGRFEFPGAEALAKAEAPESARDWTHSSISSGARGSGAKESIDMMNSPPLI